MNMRGTVNTNSVNKRLGVWRQITAEAIRSKLFSLSDTIDPSKKNFGIEDERRNQSEPKPPLSVQQEEDLLEIIKTHNDSFWYDCIVFYFFLGYEYFFCRTIFNVICILIML